MTIFKQPIIKYSLILLAGLSLTSCVCHHDDEPELFRVGHVLCSDGSVMSLCNWMKSTKTPVGIVYAMDENPDDDILGYAVYINNIGSASFADELGVEQGTTTSITDLDGNFNTYSIYATKDVVSEMANTVFDIWTVGQSAYIPSVAELRLLYSNIENVNKRIEAVGGQPLPTSGSECWLWSSTEVEGQAADKAWLFSMNYSSIQETPKNQKHPVRPVIAIRK